MGDWDGSALGSLVGAALGAAVGSGEGSILILGAFEIDGGTVG